MKTCLNDYHTEIITEYMQEKIWNDKTRQWYEIQNFCISSYKTITVEMKNAVWIGYCTYFILPDIVRKLKLFFNNNIVGYLEHAGLGL